MYRKHKPLSGMANTSLFGRTAKISSYISKFEIEVFFHWSNMSCSDGQSSNSSSFIWFYKNLTKSERFKAETKKKMTKNRNWAAKRNRPNTFT